MEKPDPVCLNQSGDTEVYAKWTAHANRATDAKYTIRHANGSDTITVNQQQSGGQWNLLGSYNLNTSSTIVLSSNANGYVIADGIKLVTTTTGAPSGVYYVHNDHLGTPQTLTDDNQDVVWSAEYDPFGKANITAETVTNNIRFPGQYFDEETNLHYNYFRTYDPTTGRYITSDPIGLSGGLNTYSYALGNPIRYTDPTGQAVPLAVYACIASPQCAVLVVATCHYLIKAVNDTAQIIYKDECDGEQCDGAGDEHPPERKDLNDLIKDLTNDGRKPLSADDADAAIDLADEIGVPGVRDDRNVDHWKGGPHIHIPQTGVGDGRHIPALPHE